MCTVKCSAFASSSPSGAVDRKKRPTFPQMALTRHVLKLRFLLNSFIHAAAPSTGFSLGCRPGASFTLGGLFEFLPPLAEARNCQSLFGWGVSVIALLQERDEGMGAWEYKRSSHSRYGSNESPLQAHGYAIHTVPPGRPNSGFARCRAREGHPRTSHRVSALTVAGSLESNSRSLVEPKVIGERESKTRE